MFGLFLSLLGIVAIVICAIQAYKAAVDTGRTPALWTLLTIGIGVFFQFLLPLMIGIVVGVYMFITGTPLDELAISAFGMGLIFEIFCLALSVAGMFFVITRVARIPDETSI